MTKAAATSLFVQELPNCAISSVARDYEPTDDVAYWSCVIEDVNTGHRGAASFPEHWPQVESCWNVGDLPEQAMGRDFYTDGAHFGTP